MLTILKRSLASITYSSLCMPEDIAERGLKDIPNFYYRDDGLRLWDIINRYDRQLLFCIYCNFLLFLSENDTSSGCSLCKISTFIRIRLHACKKKNPGFY